MGDSPQKARTGSIRTPIISAVRSHKNAVTGIYICYWTMRDPLCQSQSLPYLKRLTACGFRFALITFEQSKYALYGAEKEAARRELAAEGIEWYPLPYHHRFSLLAKALDLLSGVVMGVLISLRHRPRVVHSRSTIPAAMALILHQLCKLKFLYDADSRLSLEYVDNGRWSRKSLSFKITSQVEAWARKKANRVVVLTEQLRHDFLQVFGVGTPIQVIPCCVDTSHFQFDPTARTLRRRELGLEDQKLFIYVGKVGPRYLVAETFAFLKSARESMRDARLLILSGDLAGTFEAIAEGLGISRDAYVIKRVTPAEVPSWLCAADVGLAFIRSAECERGSSPIKLGEYLATTLPVVMTDNIGDYSELVRNDRLGVVVEDHTPQSYRTAVESLLNLLQEGSVLRDRCRTAAEAHLSLDHVGLARYFHVYWDLLQ